MYASDNSSFYSNMEICFVYLQLFLKRCLNTFTTCLTTFVIFAATTNKFITHFGKLRNGFPYHFVMFILYFAAPFKWIRQWANFAQWLCPTIWSFVNFSIDMQLLSICCRWYTIKWISFFLEKAFFYICWHYCKCLHSPIIARQTF